MNMKIGYPTHPRKGISEEIVWIGENGFEFVDLFIEDDCCSADKIDIGEIKMLLKRYNLGIVGHSAHYLPIASPCKALRDAAVEEIEKSILVCSSLGAKYLTVHADWPNSLFSPDEGLRSQAESLKRLMSFAKKYDVEIVYESTAKELDTPDNVSKLIKLVPELSLHLDVGHMNLYNRNPLDYIERFHKRIRHVHLHDNDGTKDQHLPLGAGKIPLKEVVKELKQHYDGTITIEVFSKERAYILHSKSLLREMWDKD
jgi:sugar phosphate isomerase/epimerase